ncbi:Fis family transcriptional regulator [Gloeocapsa sp. BRSZ]
MNSWLVAPITFGSSVKMTSEIKLPREQSQKKDSPAIHTGYAKPTGVMDRCQRDRFELLSAFLDGEVTAAERQQVEEWLANDVEMQRLYARLLKLRQSIRTLPTPTEHQPVEQTVQQVLTRIDRRRSRRVALWGGTAIAALFVGALSGVFTGRPSLQLAGLQSVPEANETLMVAVNSPVIEIPKAAVVSPEPHFINQADYRHE